MVRHSIIGNGYMRNRLLLPGSQDEKKERQAGTGTAMCQRHMPMTCFLQLGATFYRFFDHQLRAMPSIYMLRGSIYDISYTTCKDLYNYYCVHAWQVYVVMHAMAHVWQSEDNSMESVLCVYNNVDSGDWTQSPGLCYKCLYPLNHFATP